jgi:hypothetical protein
MRTALKKQEEQKFVMPGEGTKLDAPQRLGYVRRWAINRPGNLEELQSYGYTFAADEFAPKTDVTEGSAMDTRISRPAGGGFTYYLMEVTLKRHKEIQKFKDNRNAEITKAIGIPNSPNVYAPKFNGKEQLGVEVDTE